MGLADTPGMIAHALHYAARGWRVFPLHTLREGRCTCSRDCGKNAGKHPRIKAWHEHATTDPAAVERWWRRWPDANIGLTTGAGVTVLDVDGRAGWEELQSLVQRNTTLPQTLTAQTGSGLHLYFAAVDGVRSSAKGNLHVRGAGGYVVAPPSAHRSGKTYRWLLDAMPAAAPNWLAAWMREGGGGPAPVANPFAGLGPLPAYLRREVMPPEPTRDKDKTAPPVAISRLPGVAIEAGTPWTAHEEARLRSALAALPADNYDQWVRTGMALHALDWDRSDGTSIGFELWDQWSQGAPAKYSAAATQEKWLSFGKRSGYIGNVTVASIYHAAQAQGWTGQVLAEKPAYINGIAPPPDFFAPRISVIDGPNSIIFPDVDKAGRPRITCVNTRKALQGLKLSCEHDTFHDRLLLGGQALDQWAGELTDRAVEMLRVMVHRVFGFDPTSQHARDAAVQECLLNPFDPVQDYLEDLAWDREPRLGHWLHRFLGADDSKLNRAIGALSLIAGVRRARKPGAKFDTITVLIGEEGRGKSQALEIMAGANNFSDQQILTLDDKGQQEAVQGVWLYEIADLAGMSRADTEKVKAFASRRVDRARPAWGRTRQDKPRRCVFFATTNHETFLKSQTGNRRFWPVSVGHVDLDGLAGARDQLWAEAAYLESGGGPLTLPRSMWQAAGTLQLSRLEADPWDDELQVVNAKARVYEAAGAREQRVTSRELFRIYLGLPLDRVHDAAFRRVSHCMRRLGWEGPVTFWMDGAPQRGYRRKLAAE